MVPGREARRLPVGPTASALASSNVGEQTVLRGIFSLEGSRRSVQPGHVSHKGDGGLPFGFQRPWLFAGRPSGPMRVVTV